MFICYEIVGIAFRFYLCAVVCFRNIIIDKRSLQARDISRGYGLLFNGKHVRFAAFFISWHQLSQHNWRQIKKIKNKPLDLYIFQKNCHSY